MTAISSTNHPAGPATAPSVAQDPATLVRPTAPRGWALAIEPDGPGRCRLLARFRFPRGAVSVGDALLLELPHFLMERKMLLEIKRRAEGPA